MAKEEITSDEFEASEFDREGGAAFPLEFVDSSDSEWDGQQIIDFGMSLRDYFSAKAMQGLVTHGQLPTDKGRVAAVDYEYADAMIKERNKGAKPAPESKSSDS